MEANTGNVVDTVVVPVTEVSYSNAMEKEGFKRLLFSFCLVLHINVFFKYRSSHQRSYIQKGVLKFFANSQENTCVGVPFLSFQPQVYDFIKRDTLIQMFSCKFCEIFKNTFFTGYLRETSFVAKNQNIQHGRFIKPNFCFANALMY